MNKKEVSPQLFFCTSEEVTQSEIPAFAARAVGPLHEALAAAGLESSGDLQFICPEWKGPDAKNKLIIAIPIQKQNPVELPWFIWESPAFSCAWIDHKGPMPSLKAAWDSFVQDAESNGLHPSGGWREVYKHWVSFESEEDVTELQLGIKQAT